MALEANQPVGAKVVEVKLSSKHGPLDVVSLLVKGNVVLYNGPPLQELLYENIKI